MWSLYFNNFQFLVSIIIICLPAKVKVVLYTFIHRGVPAREEIFLESSACEVGWPVPFCISFISPMLPSGTQGQIQDLC